MWSLEFVIQNKSWAPHHCSLKLGSKLKYLKFFNNVYWHLSTEGYHLSIAKYSRNSFTERSMRIYLLPILFDCMELSIQFTVLGVIHLVGRQNFPKKN